MAVWQWVQRYEPHRIYDVKRVQAFLVDETYVKVGSFEAWVWVAVEPVHRYILGVYLSRHQNILVARRTELTITASRMAHLERSCHPARTTILPLDLGECENATVQVRQALCEAAEDFVGPRRG